MNMFKKTKNKILFPFLFLVLVLTVYISLSYFRKDKIEIVTKNEPTKERLEVNDNKKENGINEKGKEEPLKIEESSLRALTNKNGQFQCHWKIEKEAVLDDADIEGADEDLTGGIEEGILYVSGEDFHWQVKIKNGSQKHTVNILNKNNQIYQWSSLVGQGGQMTLKQAQEIGVIDLNKSYNWDCQETSIEDKFLEIPGDIKFIKIRKF